MPDGLDGGLLDGGCNVEPSDEGRMIYPPDGVDVEPPGVCIGCGEDTIPPDKRVEGGDSVGGP